MIFLFQVIFYQPILNVLILLYNFIPGHDLGIAIILLTIIIKLVLWPLSNQAIKSQKYLQDLQPKINELKAKYVNDKQEMSKALMLLYKEHKINPFSSCLPILIQLPFLIAVYQVFQDGMNNKLGLVYSFITRPESINTISFAWFNGFALNLAEKNIYLAILAGAAQFVQAKMMSTKRSTIKTEGAKDEDMAAIMNKQMLYFMPALTVFIGMSLPAGLTLYWFISTLLAALQQLVVFRKIKKPEHSVIEGEVVK
ncbi:MAG: YidC/Oxa1 family membrane protein insertase [Planctomycetes bacterium]|jgi:YidC/Oxa1 family membrane protein insertase|nr:YidC/Oxa1 family membrane protein insertase [Planctomycetota bacterium]